MNRRTAILGTAFAVGLLGAAPSGAAQKLLIGSTSASSSHYGYFVAVAKLINDSVDGVDAAVVETGATLDNLRRLQRDQIDFGLVTTNVAQHAYAGRGSFEGRPVDNRLMWVYTAAPQNVVVRADAGIAALTDLAGRRFNPGIKGSATERTAEAVFRVLGIAPDFVRGSTTDVVAMIKDNRVTGYVKSGAGVRLDASTLDIATFTPIHILSLSEAEQATLRAEMPDISVVTIPAGAGAGIPAYSTWSFGVAVSASPNLSADVAYGIVRAVMQDRTVQANAMAALRGADLADLTMSYGTVPLHAGAARYYEEAGVAIPERLQPAGD